MEAIMLWFPVCFLMAVLLGMGSNCVWMDLKDQFQSKDEYWNESKTRFIVTTLFGVFFALVTFGYMSIAIGLAIYVVIGNTIPDPAYIQINYLGTGIGALVGARITTIEQTTGYGPLTKTLHWIDDAIESFRTRNLLRKK